MTWVSRERVLDAHLYFVAHGASQLFDTIWFVHNGPYWFVWWLTQDGMTLSELLLIAQGREHLRQRKTA